MDLKPLWRNFSRKIFLDLKKISDPFPRENRQKIVKKGQKLHFLRLNGELTCVLQDKVILIYCKMVNFVMTLQYWAQK